MTTVWYVALPLLLVTKDVIIPQGSNASQRAYQVEKHHLPCAGAAGGIERDVNNTIRPIPCWPYDVRASRSIRPAAPAAR